LLEPDILLMVEPFSALDAITREEMHDVFRDLW
jgi:NitT/TauT family transport system ATP-binding protein